MYDYNDIYTTPEIENVSGVLGALAAISTIIMIMSLIISVVAIVSQWKIYKKAGKKGWESIVPIYNLIVLLEIVELPMWYIALFFVPIANIYAMFKIYIELAHKFGKSSGFGVMTVFFSIICLPILAFSKDCVYQGKNTQQNNGTNLENQQNFNNNQNINQEPIMYNPINNIDNNSTSTNVLGFEPTSPINNQTINPTMNVQQPSTNVTQNEQLIQQTSINPMPMEQNTMSQENMSTINQSQTNNESNQGTNIIPNLATNGQLVNNPNTDSLLQPQSNQQTITNVIPTIENQQVIPPQPIMPQNIVNVPQMNMNQQPNVETINTNNTQQMTFNGQQPVNTSVQGINIVPIPNIQNPENNQNM